jgi:hypothetical protein
MTPKRVTERTIDEGTGRFTGKEGLIEGSSLVRLPKSVGRKPFSLQDPEVLRAG